MGVSSYPKPIYTSGRCEIKLDRLYLIKYCRNLHKGDINNLCAYSFLCAHNTSRHVGFLSEKLLTKKPTKQLPFQCGWYLRGVLS